MAKNRSIDAELVLAKALAALPEEDGSHWADWEHLSPQVQEMFYRRAREELKIQAILVPVDTETNKLVRPEHFAALLTAVAEYAVQAGEGWRVGHGAEIMDAYQAIMEDESDAEQT